MKMRRQIQGYVYLPPRFFAGIFYNKFMGGGLLIITLIFYNVSIGCNLVDSAKSV